MAVKLFTFNMFAIHANVHMMFTLPISHDNPEYLAIDIFTLKLRGISLSTGYVNGTRHQSPINLLAIVISLQHNQNGTNPRDGVVHLMSKSVARWWLKKFPLYTTHLTDIIH